MTDNRLPPLSATSALQRSIERDITDRAALSRSKPTPLKAGPLLIALCVVLIAAIALGGGGVRYGLANLVVQLTALAILACFRDSFFDFWSRAPIVLRILVAASLALPLLQLVPLPESFWTALPGRTLAAQARESIGAMGWAPASLDHTRTLVALTGLIVPLTILAIGWSVPLNQLPLAGWLIVVGGLVNLLVGAGQVVSTEGIASFYPENPMPGVLFGTFANRNSTGVFLVSALALAILLPAPRPHPLAPVARLIVCLALLTAITLTMSRTALVLAALPLALAGVRYVAERVSGPAGGGEKNRKGVFAMGLATLAVAALATLLALAPGRLGDTLDRFDNEANPRAYIWEDALYASDRYWPAGAGMGTFDEVFQIDESLENMTQRRAGRAHNDYIEVAIEAGLAGLALIAAWLVLCIWLTWRARSSPQRWIAWSGSTILLAIALQSITDYPLRNQTMLATGALALLMLARCAAPQAGVRRAGKREK